MSIANAKGFLLDLDGVTWFGETLAPGAQAFWDYTRAAGIPVAFVSNASSASRASIQQKLIRLGLAGVEEAQIFPATRAAALYVAQKHPDARVFLIGEQGLGHEITAAGSMLVEEEANFVVVGIDRQLVYARLERACTEVMAGAELVTTNDDNNYPTDHGIKPSAGPFAAFIAKASGRPITVIGKPEAELLRQALAYLQLEPPEAVMVGDRPEADLLAARRAGTQCVMIGDWAHDPLVQEHQPELMCGDLGDVLSAIRR